MIIIKQHKHTICGYGINNPAKVLCGVVVFTTTWAKQFSQGRTAAKHGDHALVSLQHFYYLILLNVLLSLFLGTF